MNGTPRPMAGTDQGHGLRNRIRNPNCRMWDILQRRVRGSVHVAIRVEQSLGLLIGYSLLGASIALVANTLRALS